MNRNEGNIVQTLSYLYEILLQIGTSFDIQENAKSFLMTLMLQQNFSFAGYYNIDGTSQMKTIFSIPKSHHQELTYDQRVFEILQPGQIVIIKREQKGFDFFNHFISYDPTELAIFYAGVKSILVLSKKRVALDIDELNKYSIVLNKFCLFMESLSSHNQINHEIMIKNEQAKTIAKNNILLEQQNVELKKYINSNNELEKFAYITSHDLKAPLKTLTGFSKLLKDNSESNLTPKQLEYLDYIEEGVQEMDKLIDGVLAFSKAKDSKLTNKKINLHTLLTEIQQMLYNGIHTKKAQIIEDDIPEYIYGQEIRIKQLFLNLLDNALKFSRTDIPLIIKITCVEDEQQYLFSIQDNGIGIRDEDKSNIFNLFEKSTTDTEHMGSGIGLSTCKRIVTQHGGMIWVESKMGVGTTFYFTIDRTL